MKVKQGAFLVLMIWVVLTGCIAAPATQFDPNGFAIGQGLTAQAAQNNQTYYGQMATATHEAPIMAITQRAADLNFAMTENSMRTTQTASSWTATPSPYPTITPSPTPDAPMTATFSALFAVQTQTVLDTQRKETSNQFWAIVLPLFLIVLLAIVILAAVTAVRQLRHRPIARDEYGKTQPLLDTASGRYINLDASPNYSDEEQSILKQAFIQWLERKYGFVPNQPRITAERQDRVKEREQIIEIDRNHRARLPKALIDPQSMRFLPEPAAIKIGKPELLAPYIAEQSIVTPHWDLMNGWDGKGALPYGVSERGLERVDTEDNPHVGVFGKTGFGKSRYFLRPVIAAALAAGQRVVVLGKQADYTPFANHPNATLIPVRNMLDPEEAAKYAGYLKRIVEEMNRRDAYLTSHNHSTWKRAGRTPVMIVLDELGNAIDLMPEDIRKLSYRLVSALSKEGRKAGLNIWIATQRAVGFKSIVEQLGRAVFYLADKQASVIALGSEGAETLTHGHFFSKFDSVRKCAAFDPTDGEINAFISSRPVKAHEPLEWIEGEIVGESPTAPQPKNEIPELAESIRENWLKLENKSKRQTARLLGREYAGAFTKIVDQVMEYLIATTTGATTQKQAETGTFPA